MKTITHNGKLWDKEAIKKSLSENPVAIMRGIVLIFNNQTADEQQCEATVKHNGIGFTGCDAKLLSSFAKQILKGRTLSEKQLQYAKKKMPKYAGQIFSHIIHKQLFSNN